jgi:hypothetical protein
MLNKIIHEVLDDIPDAYSGPVTKYVNDVIANKPHLGDEMMIYKIINHSKKIENTQTTGNMLVQDILSSIVREHGWYDVPDMLNTTFWEAERRTTPKCTKTFLKTLYNSGGIAHEDIGWDGKQKLTRFYTEVFTKIYPDVFDMQARLTKLMDIFSDNKQKERLLVISAHPLDFKYMSKGNSWSSCMASTEASFKVAAIHASMDDNTLVAYIIPKDAKKPYYRVPKIMRMLVHYDVSKNVVLLNRQYPQGKSSDARDTVFDDETLTLLGFEPSKKELMSEKRDFVSINRGQNCECYVDIGSGDYRATICSKEPLKRSTSFVYGKALNGYSLDEKKYNKDIHIEREKWLNGPNNIGLVPDYEFKKFKDKTYHISELVTCPKCGFSSPQGVEHDCFSGLRSIIEELSKVYDMGGFINV